ncbi:uncharacterized protein LOC124114405 [Haliotis rufescens]|uniref:uncharacterized protein LOC124114405 n=1 Tax=Haliotis rufescens TaxID=6454 RepID=UPI00201ED8C7|nr:uncharacterized protein LOC124114405 [Haliotis rufescens]
MSTSGSTVVLLLSIALACQARLHVDIPRQADVEDVVGEIATMSPQHYVTVSAPAATITSPGYPNKYSPNLTSVLLSIGVPYDKTEGYVSLHFTWFDIQMCPFCSCDYLYIDTLKTSLCGDSLPPGYVNNTIIIPRSEIKNNLITLSFRSDDHEQHSGFVIDYELHLHRHKPSTPFTRTWCPAVTCPMCGLGEFHEVINTSSCPTCVCTAVKPSTPLPPSRCPVLTCPTCPRGQVPERHYTLPCSTCVCTAVTPSTPLPPSKCPVLTCPTCPRGQVPEKHYTLPCSTCVCTAVTPSTPLPPSRCPVVICPACPPWQIAERQYDKACPRCVCVRSYTSTPPPQRATATTVGGQPSMLLQMLQNVAHRAETLEYAARDMKEEMRIAITLLMQSPVRRTLGSQQRILQDTPKLPDSVKDVKLPKQ